MTTMTKEIPKGRVYTSSGMVRAKDLLLTDTGVWFIRDILDEAGNEIIERGVGEFRPWVSVRLIRIGWGPGDVGGDK